MARREKQPVHKVVMTEGKRNIVHQLLEEYDIQTAEDIQEALKDLLGSTLKEMMEAEMDDHLGYENRSVLIPTITATATSPRESTAASGAWTSRCPRTGSRRLSHR